MRRAWLVIDEDPGGPLIHGLLSTMLVGAVGALIAEIIRVVPVVRAGGGPTRGEVLASLLLVLLGAGAALMGWETPQPAYKVAVMGAAFPLLFSAAVRAATSPEQRRSAPAARPRRILDYLAFRF